MLCVRLRLLLSLSSAPVLTAAEMSLSTAASSLFRGALKIPLMSAARNIVSKPAKETISTGVSPKDTRKR